MIDLERSIGVLAQTFGQNMNPVVRSIAQRIADHHLPMERFPAATPLGADPAIAVKGLLARSGFHAGDADLAAGNLIRLAKGLDVAPMPLAAAMIQSVRSAEAQLASVHPRNPLLVDGSQPETIANAVSYFSTLLAQGVKIPPERAEVTIDGEVWTGTIKPPGLQTTAMNSDIDGPFAASYGQQGIDVQLEDASGTRSRFHLQLPEAIAGVPTTLAATQTADGRPAAAVTYQTGSGSQVQSHAVEVEITPEQHQLILQSNPANTSLNYVEGLSARFFSPESVDFWQQVSARNASGGEFRGNVKAPAIVFNTFGSHGSVAFENAAELVTSFARSMKARALPEPLPPGIIDAPNVRVYSGGTTLNELGTSKPIGLSATQQQAMDEVAGSLRGLVAGYSAKYGLSQEAREAWQSSIFANPDIPSIIMPNKLIAELSQRTDQSDPGRTFADLQSEIEHDLSQMVTSKQMGDFVKLHHTPSAPGDTVALMKPADAQGTRPEFTTEWQFAVTGQKAMPVLDAVANDLQRNFDIDLVSALESQGHSYGEIRKLSLDETVDLFAHFVRDTIQSEAGNQPVTPRVIVPVDTYYEKGGKIDGSDASLIRSAAALYTAERTHVVQVDTGGGKETVGRSPLFKIAADAAGQARLDRHTDASGKGPVDPHGPNGALAPTAYARSAADMGRVFSEAYRNQAPLTADDVDRVRNRP